MNPILFPLLVGGLVIAMVVMLYVALRQGEDGKAADRRIEAARPAILAARQREQEAQARALESERDAAERRRALEAAQRWRRLMPVIAFGVFGSLVGGFLLWHHGRRRR